MLGQTLLCIPFYAIGFWGKNWFKSKTFRPKVFIACIVIYVAVTAFFDGEQNIALNMINKDPLFFYLDALCGCVSLVEISKLIHLKWLNYMGRNSIVIMMTHFVFLHINYNILHIHIDSYLIWLWFVLSWLLLSCCFIPLLRNKYYKVI